MGLWIGTLGLRIMLVMFMRMFVIVWLTWLMIVMMVVFGRVSLAGQMNIELRRRNPAPVNALKAQFVTCDAEFQQLLSQKLKIKPAIEHRAEQHVTARAGETVQVKRSCHASILHREIVNLDLHSQQRGAERLALRVGL